MNDRWPVCRSPWRRDRLNRCGSELNVAVAAGDVHLRLGGSSTTVSAITRGVPAAVMATAHYRLLAALGRHGVDPNELAIMDLTPADMLAVWQRGDIDAGFVCEPTLGAMSEAGGRVLITSREIAEEGFLTGEIGIAHSGFAGRHPEIVVQYLRNQMQAVELIRQAPDVASETIARGFDLPAAEALRQMSSLTFRAAINPSYLRQAVRAEQE